jgi:ribosomal protein S27E
MGTTAIDEAKCRGCGATLIETAEEKATDSRIPCPKCGDTRRIFNVSITEIVELHGDSAFAHKRKGHKKPIAMGKHGDELTRRTGRWAVRTRLIDRENNATTGGARPRQKPGSHSATASFASPRE